jgi:RNA polymerase sigma-70 factor, ECF subfamily
MSSSSPGEVTLLLAKAVDLKSAAPLISLVYTELHQMAVHHFRSERPGHTLQPTALVHEAYLRLFTPRGWTYQDRIHFFGSAARAMRQVLVDHARRKRAKKRGGTWQRLDLEQVDLACGTDPTDVLALDEALKRLEAFDPRLGAIVEQRFFGRLTVEETAQLLGLGASTVRQRWTFARAWLRRELEGKIR